MTACSIASHFESPEIRRSGWSCRSGRARFSALTLSALHSYLTTLARNAGRSDRPSLTLGSCRSGRARFSALTLNTLHARNAGRSD